MPSQIKTLLVGVAAGIIFIGLIWFLTKPAPVDVKSIIENQKKLDKAMQDSILDVQVGEHDDSLQYIIQGLEDSQQVMKDSLEIIKLKYANKKSAVRNLNADSTVKLLRANLISH